ncbi:ABC-type transport auxiliary lipoprotein family protein [Nannocystis radixulma]|uniref:ABC-type transport auxiliary lipoprotein family protein n=1 Tax=Nannocystis radixulma TaxID=2995305 RepID=A0ABT5BK03_9BACT|nr:ABC-type transport auxiliary lipoprotein family protein [Nannocystis radixulma]MDC0674473.1 ABC-type transport auxiliary lipoprotein family protein [Nannocystis radixulma]
MRPGIWAAMVAAILACAPTVPTTHLYRVQLPTTSGVEPSPCEPEMRGSLLVRDMRVAGAYDDARMMYRESEYQLQRYEYHEWVVSPGGLVSDALRDGYAASGWFARVEREYDASIDAELHGRVLAIEEVDLTETQWIAHLRLELELLDARTSERLWSHEYDLTRPLEKRGPVGLAAAISAVLGEVIDASAPALAAAIPGPCSHRRSQAHGSTGEGGRPPR